MPESPTPPTSSSPSVDSAGSADSSAPSSHRAKSRVTRRGVIGATGAVALGAALTPVVFAAGESDESPDPAADSNTAESTKGMRTEKFPKTRSHKATGTDPVNAAFPVGYVAVRWAGTARNGASVRVTKADGSNGEWQAAGGGCAQVNGGGTALVPASGAEKYEVREERGASDVTSLAIDTTAGPQRNVKVPSEPTRARGLRYLSRAAWGADESLRFKDGKVNSPEVYYDAQCLTVHHTDTPNDDPDPAATVRAIYEYHAITNDWGDIGYHFLIDEAGAVYEGRYSGDDDLPAHDKDGKLVTAFHTAGFNSGNIGIALIGNLAAQGPTDAAKESLTNLVTMLARIHGLSPQAKMTFTNPVNGVTKDVDTVSGHRDWLETDCPGETMYELLGEVRKGTR